MLSKTVIDLQWLIALTKTDAAGIVAAALQLRQIMLCCGLTPFAERTSSLIDQIILQNFRPCISVGNVRNMLASFSVNCDAYARS